MRTIERPLTKREIRNRLIPNTRTIKGVIPVGLNELIDMDLEEFLDYCGNSMIGSPCLMDINYEVSGIRNDGQTILVEVTGEVDIDLEDE